MSSAIAKAVAHWQSWIGRAEIRSEVLDPGSLRRYAAALGEDLDVESFPPSLAHWAFFLPVVPESEVGSDGHPKRGGVLPPVSLPRRMFAASAIFFERPLRLCEPATLTSTVADVKHRAGRAGDLVFVDVMRVIEQDRATCVSERQTIVYRNECQHIAPVVDAHLPDSEAAVIWQPRAFDLFRFSAVTFNGHRIHYDLPYAIEEEGYPGLVVHAPFTAAKLYGYARRGAGRAPTRFSFRALAPLFASQPVRLTSAEEAGEFRAIRCDGTVAMTAIAGI
jgi:3-methylfumaryl-CoA hydratase